jgi:hypothetical protein
MVFGHSLLKSFFFLTSSLRAVKANTHQQPIINHCMVAAGDRTRGKNPAAGLLPIEQPSSCRSPLRSLGIGEDPNRKNHHVESGKLKLLLQRCGRVIV